MKTNVVLTSEDRELFGITIRQNTKGQFLSVTDLQKAYEKARFIHGWSDRRISDILSSATTKERIYHLLKERGIVEAEFPAFIQLIEKHGVVKVLKKLGVYKTTGRGGVRSVMCDPYIWILLALELNPIIYAKVILWLTDTLILDRIEAGNEYRPMNEAIKSIIHDPNYAAVAIEINKKVFGEHRLGIRNSAKKEQLNLVASIELDIQKNIKRGFLKTEQDIIRSIQLY